MDARPQLAAVAAIANLAAGRGWEALDVLVDVLADVDSAGDDDLAWAALRLLGARPTLPVRLDEHARRDLWHSSYHSPALNRLVAGLPWELLADPRADLRRAGYRLLRDRSTAAHLRAALILASDPDAGLARRGLADVTGLTRNAARTSWRRAPRPELLLTAAEHAELTEAAHGAAQLLGNDTARLLTAWLAEHPAHSADQASAPTPRPIGDPPR